MSRIWLLLVAILFAILPVALDGQDPPPAQCDLRARLAEYQSGGQLSAFNGCRYAEVSRILRRLRVEVPSRQVSDQRCSPAGTIMGFVTRNDVDMFIVSAGPADNCTANPDSPVSAPPPPPLPVFSIANAESVTEGGKLVFVVRRLGSTDQTQRLFLDLQPEGLVAEPQTEVTFEPGMPDYRLELTTLPVEGDQVLTVVLSEVQGGRIGKPRLATGTILDTLPAATVPAPRYSIVPVPGAGQSRSTGVRFMVERSDLSLPAAVQYEVGGIGPQPEVAQAVAEHAPFEFADRALRGELALAPGDFDPCYTGVRVRLIGPGTNGEEAQSALEGEIPAGCHVTAEDPPQGWPDWIPIAILVISSAGAGGGIVWLLRRRTVVPEPDDTPQTNAAPPANVSADCEIDRSTLEPWNIPGNLVRWPAVLTEVRIVGGSREVSDNLPIKESDHG